MAKRKWFDVHEEKEAIEQAKARQHYAWRYVRKNLVRDTDLIKEGYYVGFRKPAELCIASTRSTLVYPHHVLDES